MRVYKCLVLVVAKINSKASTGEAVNSEVSTREAWSTCEAVSTREAVSTCEAISTIYNTLNNKS